MNSTLQFQDAAEPLESEFAMSKNDKTDGRLGRFGERLDNFEERLQRLQSGMDRLQTTVDGLKDLHPRLQAAESKLEDLHPKTWWRKALLKMREFGALGPIVGSIALGASIFVFGVSRYDKLEAKIDGIANSVNQHIADEAKFRGSTEAQLRRLLAPQEPKRILNEIANLDPSDLTQNLPALRVIAMKEPLQVGASLATVRKVAVNLHALDTSSSDYWPTVFSFLRFATRQISPNAGSPIKQLSAEQVMRLSDRAQVVFGDSVVNLSGTGIRFVGVRFHNCKIIINVRSKITFENVTFDHCTFEVAKEDEVSSHSREFARNVLGVSLEGFSISGTY